MAMKSLWTASSHQKYLTAFIFMLLRLSPKSSLSLFASFGKYVFDSGSLNMHIFLQREFMALGLLFALSDTTFFFPETAERVWFKQIHCVCAAWYNCDTIKNSCGTRLHFFLFPFLEHNECCLPSCLFSMKTVQDKLSRAIWDWSSFETPIMIYFCVSWSLVSFNSPVDAWIILKGSSHWQ